MTAALAALHAAVFDPPWSEQEIGTLIEGGATPLSEDDGFILIRLAADEAEILTLAVRPQAQRQGVARRLVQSALDTAAGKGASRMFLEVAADNLPAIGLYRGAGFGQVAIRPRYYRRADGPPQDALIFERPLNSR